MRVTRKQAEEILKRLGKNQDKRGGFDIRFSPSAISREPKQKEPPKPNRHVIGATKTKRDGLVMDSELEAFFYDNIKSFIHTDQAIWKPESVTIQKGYTDWTGKHVRAITMRPDSLFVGKAYVDPKGHRTAVFDLKLRMYKSQHDLPFILLKNKTEVNAFILLASCGKWSEICDLYRA